MTIVAGGRYELLGYLEESEDERNEGYDECDDRYWIGTRHGAISDRERRVQLHTITSTASSGNGFRINDKSRGCNFRFIDRDELEVSAHTYLANQVTFKLNTRIGLAFESISKHRLHLRI